MTSVYLSNIVRKLILIANFFPSRQCNNTEYEFVFILVVRHEPGHFVPITQDTEDAFSVNSFWFEHCKHASIHHTLLWHSRVSLATQITGYLQPPFVKWACLASSRHRNVPTIPLSVIFQPRRETSTCVCPKFDPVTFPGSNYFHE